jgi:hypothetical protein
MHTRRADGPAGPVGPDDRPPTVEDAYAAGAEGAAQAADAGVPPPPRDRMPDPGALFVLLDGLRRAAPRELEQQLTNLIREFLLTLRSLIDWYLERLDRPDREPKVEDIPIE